MKVEEHPQLVDEELELEVKKIFREIIRIESSFVS